MYTELSSEQKEVFDQNTELTYTQETPQKGTELTETVEEQIAFIELTTKHVIIIFRLQNILYSSTSPKQGFFFMLGLIRSQESGNILEEDYIWNYNCPLAIIFFSVKTEMWTKYHYMQQWRGN